MPLRTILALAATILAAAPARGQPEKLEVVRIVVDGAVSPASAEFIRDGIDDAADAPSRADRRKQSKWTACRSPSRR